ncbi:TNT domain-containing protein [Nocardia sp. NPDC127579]|uniref:TNT domain-containing protein n=1 Tax=Nocardia sp. NPDC127579 TaxID=3345402 RepID=UPI003631319F
MNYAELELILDGLKMPETDRGIGRWRDDAFCLIEEDGRFEVFWYERGNKHDRSIYKSEAAACYGFLGLVGGALQGTQRLDPGRGTPGSVDGLPDSHPAVQALVDTDIYGGLSEQTWIQQFVNPEDAGEPVGRRRLVWPDGNQHPDGFASPSDRAPARLAPGRIVDSFGTTFSKLLYDSSTPFSARSLPVDYLRSGYRRWKVRTTTPVWAGPVAPWFGQPGGGEQYFTLMPIVDLVGAGFIEEITL